jgi:Arc/MetJ-type ribon-helix-helix transcriptional regulator
MASAPSPLPEGIQEELDEKQKKSPSDVIREAIKEVSSAEARKGPNHPQDQ